MTEISKIDRLSVSFPTSDGPLVAIDDVSFSLDPGKTLALLGESGCGKSLTALALMRLLPKQNCYGVDSAFYVDGDDLFKLPEQVMRSFRGRRIAMIFQEPMTALNPVLTIRQQLAESLEVHEQLTPSELDARVLALLYDVDMPDPALRLQQYPHQLSGGQKQRVVIAMALACHPHVLIADEPTTALDVTIQAQILLLLRALQQRYEMSLLLITHDLGVVKAMADKVCLMYAGQIVECAPKDVFFNQPLHPYAQQLFLSMPSLAQRGHRLQTLIGCVPALHDLPTGCRFHPRCHHAFARCSTEPPLIQHLSSHQQVRCHLYPEHALPPAVIREDRLWDTSEQPDEIVMSVENLCVYFGTRSWFGQSSSLGKAVDEISFSLKKGKTLALVGESGSGKTTVSRALLGLQRVTSGDIWFEGQRITHLHGRALRAFRNQVQLIFQDPYSAMNPRMTIGEIIAEGLRAQRWSSARIQQRQYELLDQVHLPRSSLARYPHQCSGGQRQRICIARALATGPSILICDEPTSALDMSVQAQILNVLKTLQHTLGLSYLFITHNMGVVSYLADEVLVMKEGRAIEMGSCEQVLSHPEASYTKQLLRSVLTV